MDKKELMKKLVLTNVSEYQVSDTDCENLILKANLYGVPEVLFSPVSFFVADKYSFDNISYSCSASYPAGAVFPDMKAEEVADNLAADSKIDAVYVTAAEGYFRSGNHENLREEMKLCVEAAAGKKVYFFIEAAEMSDEELKLAVQFAKETGVKGLVSSNGFLPYETPLTKPEDIARMKAFAGNDLEILAFGLFEGKEKDALNAGADKVLVTNINAYI